MALLSVVASLEDNAAVGSAHAEVAAFVRRRAEKEPRLSGRTGGVTALSERVAGPSRPLLFLLLSASGAVLLTKRFPAWLVTANRVGKEGNVYWDGVISISNPVGDMMWIGGGAVPAVGLGDEGSPFVHPSNRWIVARDPTWGLASQVSGARGLRH